MAGEFPPVTRMGGKRAVAAHVLDVLGTWPTRWLMVDADVAIVEFWQAAFGGWLPAVAEIIRDAPCDGEELWKLWKDEPVPVHPLGRVARWQIVQAGIHSAVPVGSAGAKWVRGKRTKIGDGLWKHASSPKGGLHRDLLAARNERLARWIVLQKGNFSGKPLSYGEKWEGVAGYSGHLAPGEPGRDAEGFVKRCNKDSTSDGLEAFWEGVAGYASVSESANRLGWKDRFQVALDADRLDRFTAAPGSAMYLDLATSSPVFRPGDLVSIDPPYQGTTGYGPALTRERVVELAEEAHEADCRVLVHETEPVINGGPWRSVELQRRYGANQDTWRKGRKNGDPGERRQEWLTLNFEPARTVSHTMAPVRTCAGFEGPLWDLDDEIQATAARLYDEAGTILGKPADAEPEMVYLPAWDR